MRSDNLIRILYLQSNSEIGGSDVSLLRIVENLDRSRFHPVVVLPSNGPLVRAFEDRRAKVIIGSWMLKLTTRKGWLYYLQYLVNYPMAIVQLVRLIRRERIDLVHTNTLHNLYGWLAARLARRPHIWHVREIVVQSAVVRSLEVFLARRFAARIIAVSSAAAEMFRNRDGEYPGNLKIVWNGINLGQFTPAISGTRIRSELGLPVDAPVIGVVGRLDHGKGLDIFLKAAGLCRLEFPDARYLVCGGEVQGQKDVAREVLLQTAELGLSDVVVFTGWRYGPEDMPEVYAALDMLVSASTLPESFGLVMVEAMATGKPVIATNQGGPQEICVDGETAVMVRPKDARVLADAILGLLRSPARAAALGCAGRERAECVFDERKQAQELRLIYEEVLKA
jgi:glycosyltransferase involved in cell wall biosynthesis